MTDSKVAVLEGRNNRVFVNQVTEYVEEPGNPKVKNTTLARTAIQVVVDKIRDALRRSSCNLIDAIKPWEGIQRTNPQNTTLEWLKEPSSTRPAARTYYMMQDEPKAIMLDTHAKNRRQR